MAFRPRQTDAPLSDDSIEVSLDGYTLAPAVYGSEISGTAEMQTLTDDCGHAETEKLSSGNVTITLQAYLYRAYASEIWRNYDQGDSVEVTLPLEIEGTLTLEFQDVTIRQGASADESAQSFTDDDGNEYQVWDVQMQLKAPGADPEQ